MQIFDEGEFIFIIFKEFNLIKISNIILCLCLMGSGEKGIFLILFVTLIVQSNVSKMGTFGKNFDFKIRKDHRKKIL